MNRPPAALPAGLVLVLAAALGAPSSRGDETSAAKVTRGESLLAQDEPARAAKEFESAVASEPTLAKAHAGLVKALLAQGQKPKALAAAQKGAQSCPADPDVLLALGLAQEASDNHAAAREAAAKVLALVPGHPAAARLVGEAVVGLDGADAGAKAFLEVVQKTLATPALLYEYGDFLVAHGKPLEALDPLRRSAAEARLAAPAHARAAEAFVALAKPKEAKEEARLAVAADASDARAHAALGRALEAGGENAEAVGAYEQAARLRPRSAGYQVDLGYAYARTGRWKDAEPALRGALKIDPDLPEAHLQLGWVLDRTGRQKEALAEYAAVLKAVPNHPRALWYEADLQYFFGKTKDAQESLKRLLVVSPGHSEAYRLLARMSYEAGRVEEAKQHLEQALRNDPKNARAILLRGRLHDDAEEYDDAEKDYLAAIEADPKYAWPHLYMAELHEEDKPEEALKHFQAYLDLGGADPDGTIAQKVKSLGNK